MATTEARRYGQRSREGSRFRPDHRAISWVVEEGIYLPLHPFERRIAIRALRERGKSTDDIADQLRISQRSVERILAIVDVECPICRRKGYRSQTGSFLEHRDKAGRQCPMAGNADRSTESRIA